MRLNSSKGQTAVSVIMIIFLLLLILCSCFIGKSAFTYDDSARIEAEKALVETLADR